jgi:hypothetical protein
MTLRRRLNVRLRRGDETTQRAARPMGSRQPREGSSTASGAGPSPGGINELGGDGDVRSSAAGGRAALPRCGRARCRHRPELRNAVRPGAGAPIHRHQPSRRNEVRAGAGVHGHPTPSPPPVKRTRARPLSGRSGPFLGRRHTWGRARCRRRPPGARAFDGARAAHLPVWIGQSTGGSLLRAPRPDTGPS